MLKKIETLADELLQPLAVPRGDTSIERYSVACAAAWKPEETTAEHPICMLDCDGGYLVLFGQWLYDPHIVRMPYNDFERWDVEAEFVSAFQIAFAVPSGRPLRLLVTDGSLLPMRMFSTRLQIQRLRECEILRKAGRTLEDALLYAGVLGS